MFPDQLFLEQVVRKIEILNDNEISLILIRNLKSQNCTKYIDIIDILLARSFGRRRKTRI